MKSVLPAESLPECALNFEAVLPVQCDRCAVVGDHAELKTMCANCRRPLHGVSQEYLTYSAAANVGIDGKIDLNDSVTVEQKGKNIQ